VGNQWIEEPEVVHREAKKLFEVRFLVAHGFGVRLGLIEFKSLSAKASLSMISNFTEEVKEVVWMCEGSKSPSPYGFNFNFIKNSWEVLMHDVVATVHHFQETVCISKGCNTSFIALIPKVRDSTKQDQYRSISLVGSLYKIISKVLSCYIKCVLPEVIDDCQSAFLKDRVMLDSFLVANEGFEELKRKGKRDCV